MRLSGRLFQSCWDYVVHAHFKDGRWLVDPMKEGSNNRSFPNELIGEGAIDHAGCLRAITPK